MSDKRIVDPLLTDLAARCCRLDQISNDIHSALRTQRDIDHPKQDILEEVQQAIALCSQIIGLQKVRKSASPGLLHGVSFALRAAHEATEALLLADNAGQDRNDEQEYAAHRDVGSTDAPL